MVRDVVESNDEGNTIKAGQAHFWALGFFRATGVSLSSPPSPTRVC